MPKIKTGDIHTYYEVHGAGESLILIHGLGSSGRDWEYQVAFFAPHYQVITYDARGHGQTEKAPGTYSIPLFADDLLNLMDTLAIPNAHIVGISMGGTTAFQFTVSHPERVKSMTIVNSFARYVPENFRQQIALFQRLVLFRLYSMRKIGEILSKRLFVKPEQAELRQVLIDRWAENHKPSYMAAMRGMVGWSVWDHLEEITIPSLIISADEDYTPVAAKEAYAARMPNAELVVVEDSRHATPVEKPEIFNQILFEFLRDVRLG
jgi:pimeloyl-ACP methyl ester carboxylesterase